MVKQHCKRSKLLKTKDKDYFDGCLRWVIISGHLRSRYSDVKVKYTHGLYIIVKNDHKYLSRKGIAGCENRFC